MSNADTLEAAVSESLTVMSQMLANPKPINAPVLEAWVILFRREGLTPAEVRAAAGKILATERFYPEPVVFIEAARPPLSDAEAENAWVKVRRFLATYGSYASAVAKDFDGDAAALWAADQIGFEELGEMDDGNRSIRRAEFVRNYRLARAEGYAVHHLAGRFERENRARGLTLAGPACGRPDWETLPAVVAGTRALPEATGLVRLEAA